MLGRVISMSVLNRILRVGALAVTALAVASSAGTTREAAAALPPGNTVAQWNQIAENTVVGSGAFQSEGYIYTAYVSAAVYDAVVAIEGGFEPYGPAITAPAGASVDCAVVEAAYRTLLNYFSSFPALVASLDANYAEALSPSNLNACTADGGAGTGVGRDASASIITLRSGDGRVTPIGLSTSFPTLAPGPGVWRLTPPFLQPQVPWVGNVHRFILGSVDQFLPDPPPSLSNPEWVEAFDEIKAYGVADSSVRSDEQTAVAKFWSANVVRQYNRAGRDLIGASPDLLTSARLMAMINLVGADALMSALYAKYHYLFWRPVTAVDPTAVTADGFGPMPRLRRRESGDGRANGLAAAPDDAEPPGVPRRARRDHVGDGRGLQHLPRHEPHRPCRARFRPRGTGRQLERGAAVRHAERPAPRDHQRPRLGGPALPLLGRRRCRPRPQGGQVRPQPRLPTDWLVEKVRRARDGPLRRGRRASTTSYRPRIRLQP
jgi:hypothetical protein